MLNRMGWLVLLGGMAWHGAALAGNGPAVGKDAPNIIGRTLADDKLYRLSGDRGKAKVINFFWVECKPCRLEMPELAQMEKKYPKLKFISVHAPFTKEVPAEEVDAFVKKLAGAPSTIVLTAESVMQDAYHYPGLPHTVVLDENNVVVANFAGYTPDNMRRMSKLLGDLSR